MSGADLIQASYPCCGKPCRLDPRRKVTERLRHFCRPDDEVGTAYRIEVTELPSPTEGLLEGAVIRQIEFYDLASNEALREFGRRTIPERRLPVDEAWSIQ